MLKNHCRLLIKVCFRF